MEPENDDSDHQNSLDHAPTAAESSSDAEQPAAAASPSNKHSPTPAQDDDTVKEDAVNGEEMQDKSSEAPSPEKPDSDGPADAASPQYTSTTTTTRRNPNGSVSSVYSGNKIRHLKKEDGVPLWRKDIQFDFLKFVFEDDKAVFHKASDGTSGHTFADIYLDAMAKSSKCSKILKEKLLTERPAALNMAMVCLLVNVGRMNTTLNCT
jgi:Ino eighty subunit 1